MNPQQFATFHAPSRQSSADSRHFLTPDQRYATNTNASQMSSYSMPSFADHAIISTWIPPSAQEQHIYGQLFALADEEKVSIIGGRQAVSFFSCSKLEKAALREIWDLADWRRSSELDQNAFFVALRLISMKQNGELLTMNRFMELSKVVFHLPRFEFSADVMKSNNPSMPIGAKGFEITGEEKAKYISIFEQYNSASNEFIDGAEAAGLFQKSGLDRRVLREIWNLSDRDQDGRLDINEFCIAMHLIVCISKRNLQLPPSLPSELLNSLRCSRIPSEKSNLDFDAGKLQVQNKHVDVYQELDDTYLPVLAMPSMDALFSSAKRHLRPTTQTSLTSDACHSVSYCSASPHQGLGSLDLALSEALPPRDAFKVGEPETLQNVFSAATVEPHHVKFKDRNLSEEEQDLACQLDRENEQLYNILQKSEQKQRSLESLTAKFKELDDLRHELLLLLKRRGQAQADSISLRTNPDTAQQSVSAKLQVLVQNEQSLIDKLENDIAKKESSSRINSHRNVPISGSLTADLLQNSESLSPNIVKAQPTNLFDGFADFGMSGLTSFENAFAADFSSTFTSPI